MPHMEMAKGLRGMALVCSFLEEKPRTVADIRAMLTKQGYSANEISSIFTVICDYMRLAHVRRGTDSPIWELNRQEFKADRFR